MIIIYLHQHSVLPPLWSIEQQRALLRWREGSAAAMREALSLCHYDGRRHRHHHDSYDEIMIMIMIMIVIMIVIAILRAMQSSSQRGG
mmetsp:Transcript_11125/g.31035  ORF Transcript_11125/g.31035 Transcript_11125/m.31035 type:complete len:88 (-) Transcript_11125:158-421(-)